MIVRVRTPTPAHDDYDVVIGSGALERLPRLVQATAAADRYAVLAPEPVAALYGEALVAALRREGLGAELLSFPDGESHKVRATWAALTDRMLELRFTRSTCVIALGGGVAGDLAGFVAATYMRGVPVVQVPTTLLAMIDAAVGGKTAVDTAAGKNLVGAFHPPRLVLMDPVVLRTLPAAIFQAGLAEAIKHGAVLDCAYFDWITAQAGPLLLRDAVHLARLVERSVELKAGIVSEDPYDHGPRALLNFGHTVGHALEQQTGYALPHGSAVAVGMVVETLAGEAMGVTEAGTADRLVHCLQAFGLPTTVPPSDPRALLDFMKLDKKSRRGVTHCVLLHGIGRAAPTVAGGWTHEVPDAVLMKVLAPALHSDNVV
jgi:3-dehydroquinate synthase